MCNINTLTGANFTVYQELKKAAQRWQPDVETLPSYQHMIIGLVSGACGPFSNAPIDTIKTRKYLIQLHPRTLPHASSGLQKSAARPGQSAFSRITYIAADMWKREGVRSFYKGITPRVLRVAPGKSYQ